MKTLILIAILSIAALGQTPKCTLSEFHQLSPADKVAVIKGKLVDALADENLTPQQRKLIRDVYDSVKPENYGGNHKKDSLEDQVRASFTKEQLAIFAVPLDSPYYAKLRPANYVKPEIACYCSFGSSFNVSCSSTCRAGPCWFTDDGCGFLGYYPCDGKCNL